MNYKQLKKISLNLLHSKFSIESCLLKEESDNDINLLGYINYINLYLTNIIDCYKSIKNEIEILHFKTKEVPEWWEENDNFNLKEDLIQISNELPLIIPKLVKEYIERSDGVEEIFSEGFSKFFSTLKRYKLIDGEMIEMTEDEIIKYDAEKQIEAINAAYSVDDWESYRNKIKELIEQEKYEKLLVHLKI